MRTKIDITDETNIDVYAMLDNSPANTAHQSLASMPTLAPQTANTKNASNPNAQHVTTGAAIINLYHQKP